MPIQVPRARANLMTSKDLNKVQNEVKKASEKTLTGAVKAWCQLFKSGKEINEILKETDFYLLNVSCNGGDTAYAAQKLLAMHQAFETVYGEGYVDEAYGMVMMPAVVCGRDSGIRTLALVTLDLESSGEHFGTIFMSLIGQELLQLIERPAAQVVILFSSF